MTGRELIIFILENNFEDVEFTNVCDILGVMTVKQAALKQNTGEATIKTLFELKKIRGWKNGENIYILEQPNPFNYEIVDDELDMDKKDDTVEKREDPKTTNKEIIDENKYTTYSDNKKKKRRILWTVSM